MMHISQATPLSFNGKILEVGDKVIIVYGKHLRNSVIESITGSSIKVNGIRRLIHSNNIIR